MTGTFDTSKPVGTERRSVHRTRVLKGANLRFNNGYSVFEGTVRNLTDGGALLAFGDATGVPGEFDMDIAGESMRRRAHVIWRETNRMGVRFG